MMRCAGGLLTMCAMILYRMLFRCAITPLRYIVPYFDGTDASVSIVGQKLSDELRWRFTNHLVKSTTGCCVTISVILVQYWYGK